MNSPKYRIAYITYCNLCECIKIGTLFRTIGAINKTATSVDFKPTSACLKYRF